VSAVQRFQAAYRSRRSVRWASDVGVMVLLVLAISAWQTRHHRSGQAPAFALQSLEGGELVSNSSLRGKPTMVVFWAPWCGVCRAETPNLRWVHSLVGAHANVVSVVASYQSRAEVQRQVDEQAMRYPVLLGSDALTQSFAVEAFPTVYFLDSTGSIRHSVTGYTTTLGLLWRLFVP
jgi:thiol-disulfide isomerase/thioredoxin